MNKMSVLKVDRRAFMSGTLASLAFATTGGATLFGSAMSAHAAPRYGGTLVVGLGVEPRNLNLALATAVHPKIISSSIFNKLAVMDRRLDIHPDLAERWEVSDDASQYTFFLRKGVKWHDGTPFTSEDVRFSFEKILFAIHNIGRGIAPLVERIDTPADDKVVFVLKSPNDSFMTFLAAQGHILPKHLYDVAADIEDNPVNMAPVGTGPFRFVEWKKGEQVTLERNPDYFDPSRPYLDRIVIRFVPSSAARLLMIQSGEIDYLPTFELPPSAISELSADKDLTVTSDGHEAWGSIVMLMPNMERQPLDKIEVRQALMHAMNRDMVVQLADFGLGTVAAGPISSKIEWAFDAGVHQYPFDAAKAAALLDAAGVGSSGAGPRFSCGIVVNRAADPYVKAAQVIAEQWKAVGIDARVEALDWPTAIEKVYVKRDFDFLLQSSMTGPDPALGMQRSYLSSNIRPVNATNAMAYRNPEVDALFEAGSSSSSRQERAQIYKKVSAILAEEVAALWLWEVAPYSAFRKDFANLHANSAESIYNFADAYLVEGKESRG